MKESFACHAENSKIRLCKDEKAVQHIVSCFLAFQCDPFDESNIKLTSLRSGQIAMDELVQDFETAHADGEILVKFFLQNVRFQITSHFRLSCIEKQMSSFSKPPAKSTAV